MENRHDEISASDLLAKLKANMAEAEGRPSEGDQNADTRKKYHFRRSGKTVSAVTEEDIQREMPKEEGEAFVSPVPKSDIEELDIEALMKKYLPEEDFEKITSREEVALSLEEEDELVRTLTSLEPVDDTADPEQVKAAKAVLEQRIKKFAKDIQTKYIALPHTTKFGIMFLPTEGLYAEVVRLGLVEVLQHQFNISVAGPTTLAALLNSLQMGFRTLAIQKRSGEVWQILGAVKTEFGTFQTVLEAAQKRIEQTGKELEKLVGTRTRQIERKLRGVEALPLLEAQTIMGADADTATDEEA